MKVVSLENLSKYNELLNQKTVRSVNSVKPDSNGNVRLDVLTTPGNIIKWETDFFDIGPSKTLSFDLTGTVFENEERSNINFKLVAKVKNGNDVLQAGDILFTDYNNYIGNSTYSEVGSYSYIRDKKLYIHFGNTDTFTYTTSDSTDKTYSSALKKIDVQCKIILTKIITDPSGEMGYTPKSVTNIVGVTNNRNLGEIFTSSIPLESSQVHLLDGSVLTDSSELYDYLESIKDTNPDLFTTDSEFNSEVESTGKCSKFVINTDNKTVRIPKGDSNNYIVIKSFEKKFEFNQPFTLLEPKWSDVPLNNLSWLLSNGQVNSSENYPSVYELLSNEYNNGELKTETVGDVSISFKQLDNGHKIVTDKTAYEKILKNTGTAWYYLLDLDSRTFVLPQTNGFMQFGNESGKFTEAGLPNITGKIDSSSSTNYYQTFGETVNKFTIINGAFSGQYHDVRGTPDGPQTFNSLCGFDFDASRSNSIYDKSDTVQPNSVTGYLYFYVGECVGTSNIVELGNLKDKLDLDVNNIKTELTTLKISLLSPVHYSRSSNFETSGQTSIKLPSYLSLMVNGHHFRNDVEVTVDITDSANWDSTETDYTVAENRAGKDFYIYAVDDKVTKSVHIVLSANSTVPTGYTESSSRKIGGFHCLCADVGTPTWRNPATLKDEAHWLSGYVKGDILPYSVWDLLHRAESSNEGMVYSPETHMWYDIYLASWDGSKLVSTFGGITADGASAKKFHGEMFAECAGQINKELISRDEFIVVAKGSNERTNIHGSADVGTTGGHVDTANRRMISNIGLEDCCGFLWQWCKQSGSANGSSGWTNSTYNSNVDGSENYGVAYGNYYRALVGNYWKNSSNCGSRSVAVSDVSATACTSSGGRLASRERVVTGL